MRATRQLLIPLLVVALLVSACGAPVEPAANDLTDSGFRFYLGLPRLVIDFDASGQPAIAGLKGADVEAMAGLPAGSLTLPASMVEQMTSLSIQHVELAHTGDGILVYVNGEQLPSLLWTDESFGNVADVLSLFDLPFTSLVRLLTPMIERTGLNVVLRFPVPEGTEAIALRDPDAAPAAAEQGKPSAIIILDVEFDAEGVPTVAGSSSREFAEASGMDLRMLELPPDTLAYLKDVGISELRLRTTPEGLFITANGLALPHVGWSDRQLSSGAELYSKVAPLAVYGKLARMILPQLDNTDIDVVLRFPDQ